MKKHQILSLLSIVLIPVLTVLLTISINSNYLIKSWMQIIIIIFLLINLFYLIYRIIIIRKEKIKIIRKKLDYVFFSLVALLFLGCISFIIIAYGPNKSFRDWLVTTAMGTMNHQYICKWLYSDSEINKVFEENYTKESGESTDPSLIDPDSNDTIIYANEYEEKLFKNKKEDEIYRIIKFKVNGCNAYLAAVYDASRISVAVSNKYPDTGQYVTKTAELKKAVLAINGGGFEDPGHKSLGGMPNGVTISKNKIYTGEKTKNNVIGFNKDNKLVLLKSTSGKEAKEKGVRDAVTHSPFLIVNGKSSYFKGTGGLGYAARTAIGQRKDGVVLFLVVDSNATRTKGASMQDLAKIMQNYGAINAANLDGGTSSVMVENYKIINTPIDSTLQNKTRPIATAIIVK